MKFSSTLLSIFASTGFIGSASAATALIDFGTNDTATYNSVSVIAGVATSALLDTVSAPTGWTATVTNTAGGNMGNAGAGANVASFPAAVASFEATALRDSIFGNAGNGGQPELTLTFTGLNAAFSYDLLLYGSRGNAQSLDQHWSLTAGTGGAEVNHASGLNDTVAVAWTVSPDVSGNIVVLLNSPATAGALALNFASITENVPEPSSALLLGLSAMALVARRKR